ncbi:MAG: hypothetical protein M1838_005462 [Thelocarpon superellum]|nr:MAG: hypothetical protein M1838_005462 [Thelocarpon superellum]
MASKLELAVPAELHQPDVGSPPLTRLQAWRLYALHFLFTWNAHTYESAAILFTAAAYPGTLTATSIRGVSVALASVCFSATLWAWIDRSPSRLRSLSCSIGAHRCTSLAAYAVWLYILDDPIALDHLRQLWRPFDLIQPDAAERTIKQALFGPLLLLGSLEALSSVANRISIDKEWLPALAPSSAVRTGGYDLAQLNAL